MDKLRVLFLCTHNSARSQMAEGFLSHFYGERYEAFSAGSKPTRVHSLAIKVMAEVGIDISKHTSKGIEEFRNKDIDVVVTVCRSSAKEVCPFCSSPILGSRPEIITSTVPNARKYIEHGFSDPSEVDGSDEGRTEAFRRVRDEIAGWIKDTFADLGNSS
jgi:arsenate reductase